MNSNIEKNADCILDANGQPVGSSRALPTMQRRKFLGLSGAAAGGLLLSTQSASAGWFGFYSSKPVAGIPESWVRLKGDNVNRYANYVKGLRLRNVTPRMILAPHFKTRGSVVNSLPPKNLWKKMGPTLKVIDRMSKELSLPVKAIYSAYRSPRYNAAVRGHPRSFHQYNQAVDVVFHGAGSRQVASVARFLRDRKRKFEGGIGTYGGFVHIDTRGFNSDW
ncbi:MAG: D-Ala-D-Ala carboxypeptidase family metallohydrolase [Akkermansiaceae bacterium]|nr:D-Ala-D-Ala carboxypeptidase family metallohydrolase [Akkermansiaceae bacterium]